MFTSQNYTQIKDRYSDQTVNTTYKYTEPYSISFNQNQAIVYFDVDKGSLGTLTIQVQFANSLSIRSIQHSGVTGTFTLGEEITNNRGGVGKILEVDGSKIEYTVIKGSFDTGQIITGKDSGATCNTNSVSKIADANFYNESTLGSGFDLQNYSYIVNTTSRTRYRVPIPQKDSYVRFGYKGDVSASDVKFGIGLVLGDS